MGYIRLITQLLTSWDIQVFFSSRWGPPLVINEVAIIEKLSTGFHINRQQSYNMGPKNQLHISVISVGAKIIPTYLGSRLKKHPFVTSSTGPPILLVLHPFPVSDPREDPYSICLHEWWNF